MHSIRAIVTLLAALAPALLQAAEPPPLTLELSAGDVVRRDVPIYFDLPESLASCEHFELAPVDAGRAVAAQVIGASPRRLAWIIERPLEAGEARRYLLTPLAKPEPSARRGVEVADDGSNLLLSLAGVPVLQYNQAVVPSPSPGEPYFARSGYIHPLFTPSAANVTDDFAPDHMHQHGLFFAWTNTRFEGRAVNFWDQRARQGTVEHAELIGAMSGPVVGGFSAKLRHLDLTAPDAPKTALDETWDVRVYNVPGGRLIDFVSTQICATKSPLDIDQYHYGGLAIRGRRNWLEPGQGDFLTDEAKTRADGNHTRPRWCDMHGQVDGGTAGVAILGHPDNFRAPQSVRLHPDKPYFCFAPLVLGPFQIAQGEPYVSRYRLYVHDGPIDPAIADRLWADFATPAAVRIVE